ncbi:hypothetical protein O181_046600 [Austropuccinia psidii MF-1]|uniref:Reverse transcriptase domain-containing protein n=1 Tax=Austropuccinia psidii MF-1 TaxID=1389203 RepID=A0A9Q3DTP3_9BASI|nr:hypothetical protein [Austropuccinia psidii MF-1]
MLRTKPSRGKVYTDGSSCITNIVINNREAKIHLKLGAFCTCVGKDYLFRIYNNWQEQLIPIGGIKFSNASQYMHALGILEEEMIFTHPEGSIRLKVEFVVMNNCTSKNFIIGNKYLNINDHKDRYFIIGKNKRQTFAFPPEKREITVIRQVINFDKERFVTDQLIEAQIGPELIQEIKGELIEILFQYREASSSDDEPLGDVKGHHIDIILNVERPYPQLSKRKAYTASPRAREELETHINEIMKLGVFRKVRNNEEVEVTAPVIIIWNNDKLRMVGYFRALNPNTIPDKYPIPRIQETLTQLYKAKFITSINYIKGFHKNVFTPHYRKLLRIISHCGIHEYLRMPFCIEMHPLIIQ